jgi:hypothetical protein
MATPDPPRGTNTPRDQPVPRRPFYYPAGWGCLFWVAVVLAIYLIVGLLFAPVWYPWWW